MGYIKAYPESLFNGLNDVLAKVFVRMVLEGLLPCRSAERCVDGGDIGDRWDKGAAGASFVQSQQVFGVGVGLVLDSETSEEREWWSAVCAKGGSERGRERGGMWSHMSSSFRSSVVQSDINDA